jgi:hypothetical protein
MGRIVALLRDPLLHFLIVGAALFAFLSMQKPPERPADERIVVTRDALLRFVQYRSKAFEPGAAERLLDGFSERDRRKLVDDFIREEALYREAKALGVAETDYVVRERMVQSALFLADAAAGSTPINEADIEAYFKKHADDYRVAPSVTFSHVFFVGDGAEEKARAMVERLNAAGAPFEAATQFGDRFPFHVNYVERTYEYVASQFGDVTTEALFDAATPLQRWSGPYRSDYGFHAIFVSGRVEGRLPELAEIRDRVVEDAQRAKDASAREREVAEIVKRYRPEIAPDISKAPLEVPAPK